MPLVLDPSYEPPAVPSVLQIDELRISQIQLLIWVGDSWVEGSQNTFTDSALYFSQCTEFLHDQVPLIVFILMRLLKKLPAENTYIRQVYLLIDNMEFLSEALKTIVRLLSFSGALSVDKGMIELERIGPARRNAAFLGGGQDRSRPVSWGSAAADMIGGPAGSVGGRGTSSASTSMWSDGYMLCTGDGRSSSWTEWPVSLVEKVCEQMS